MKRCCRLPRDPTENTLGVTQAIARIAPMVNIYVTGRVKDIIIKVRNYIRTKSRNLQRA